MQRKNIRRVILRKKQSEKSLETKDRRIVEIHKKEQLVKTGEKSILEDYKKELPQKLETRLNEIAEQLSTRKEVQGLSTIEINELLRPHNVIGGGIKYTAEQLNIVFEYYRQAMIEINRKVKYPPSKENFCAFADISTVSYTQYLMSNDEAKQEVMLRIDDYIRENMLTSAQVGEIREITTMFRGKTAHGLVEASNPVIVEHRTETDITKINEMIEQLKKGNSLKTIELKQKEDGTYGAE